MIRPRSLLVFLALSSGLGSPAFAQPAPASTPLPSGGFTENFEAPFQPVVPAAKSPSKVSGEIPARWQDDSTFPGADVEVNYARIPDAAEGKGALRITAPRVTQGSTGLLLKDVDLPAKTFLKLRATIRSANATSAEIQVRADAKKSFLFETLTAGPEWKTVEFIVPPLDDAIPSAEVRIGGSRPMQIDIDALSLTPIDASELGADFKEKGNLLNLTSFPLGLSKPWVGTTGNVVDPAVTGPSGLPALRITPRPLIYDERGLPYFESEVSAPFAGKPNAVHTFSVFLKGSDDGQPVLLQFGPPTKVLRGEYSHRITVTKEWQRYEISARMPYDARRYYYLRIRSNHGAPLWVDQPQVEVGEKATPFRRSGAVEIALTPTTNYGLHFENQPLRVRATVYGDVPAGASLTGVFYDANERAFPVAAQPLRPGEPLQTLTFTLPRGAELPLGYYRFVALARRGAATLSKPSEAVLGRVRPPRKPDEFAPDSPFGIHTNPTDAHTQLVRDLGFKWVRIDVGWSQIERADGQWHWEHYDEEIRRLHAAKFSILGILTGGLGKYGVAPEQNRGWGFWRAMVREEHLPALKESARRIAERYRAEITHWETHNETDLPSFSFGDIVNGVRVARTGKQMFDWQKATYEGLKAGNPDAFVWWDLAWARPPESKAFVAAATKEGIWKYVEGFSYHQYNGNFLGFPNDAVAKRIEDVRSVMPAEAKNLPIWNTEGGFWPNKIRDLTPLTPPVVDKATNDYFADWVVRYHVSTFANGVPKFFFFNIRNGEYYPEHEILNADNSLSTQAITFAVLAWHLEGKTFAEMRPLDEDINLYVFSDGTESVAIPLSAGAGRLPLAKAVEGITGRDHLGNAIVYPIKIGEMPTFWTARLPAPELAARFAAALAPAP